MRSCKNMNEYLKFKYTLTICLNVCTFLSGKLNIGSWHGIEALIHLRLYWDRISILTMNCHKELIKLLSWQLLRRFIFRVLIRCESVIYLLFRAIRHLHKTKFCEKRKLESRVFGSRPRSGMNYQIKKIALRNTQYLSKCCKIDWIFAKMTTSIFVYGGKFIAFTSVGMEIRAWLLTPRLPPGREWGRGRAIRKRPWLSRTGWLLGGCWWCH